MRRYAMRRYVLCVNELDAFEFGPWAPRRQQATGSGQKAAGAGRRRRARGTATDDRSARIDRVLCSCANLGYRTQERRNQGGAKGGQECTESYILSCE